MKVLSFMIGSLKWASKSVELIFCGVIIVSLLIIVFLEWASQSCEDGRENDHAKTPNEAIVLWDSLQDNVTVERFMKNMAKEQPIRFFSHQLKHFTENYLTRLGSGGFGTVYKGEFHNGLKIAVKVLKNTTDKRIEAQFMAEIGSIGRTYHNNLVRLYGFCFDPDTKALVYEYMENGSLDKILFNKKNHRIECSKLYEIAMGTAKGLSYLHHDCEKMIIHYDIKPENILLDSNFVPKVSDFGLAKLCNRNDTHVTISGCRGTPGYTAPELWMSFRVTNKCDVYSFGMMLFEIVGRRKNRDLINSEESKKWFPRVVWEKFEIGEFGDIFEDCGIEEKDRDKAKIMFMIALWCVQYLPKARPSMKSVVKYLEEGTEVMVPPNPFQHLIGSPICMESNTESTTTTVMRKYEIEVATL